jgi:very-short-patch-repair endonuclease
VKVELLKVRKLLSRRRKTQSLVSLKDSIDYHAVLKAFPCWICTIDDVARLFPLKQGLFDVLIVDEASQCNQATALPLAFRAKQMVVVGDRKQLRPATSRFLRQDVVDVLQQRHGLVDHPRAVFLNGRDSLIELADSCSEGGEFLNEHFRCDPSIIRWSNEQFYDNRLRIMTRHEIANGHVPLEIRFLLDADDDRERKINRQEAEAIVSELRQIIESGEAERMSIGVISPYRAQARLIDELIEEEFKDTPEIIRDHRLVASTADGFQGDERDIILYSFRYGPTSRPAVVTAIQNEEERLNVAFTRAKRKGICFVSHSLNRFPRGHVRSFLEHAQSVQNEGPVGADGDGRSDRFDSEFERDVCERLRDRGLHVVTQDPCAGYYIDLVIQDKDGRQLAVECDGEWKLDATGMLRPEDYQRQEILERAGWVFHRISGRRYFDNPERELQRVEEALAQQATAWDHALEAGPVSRTPTIVVEVETEKPQLETPGEAPLEPPIEAPAEVAGLEYLGATASEQIRNVKKLAHWGIDDYQDPVLEFLFEVIDTLESGDLPAGEVARYLEDLWKSARDRGFNPRWEEIPE